MMTPADLREQLRIVRFGVSPADRANAIELIMSEIAARDQMIKALRERHEAANKRS